MWNMKKMWSLIWKQNIKLCVFSLILPPKDRNKNDQLRQHVSTLFSGLLSDEIVEIQIQDSILSPIRVWENPFLWVFRFLRNKKNESTTRRRVSFTVVDVFVVDGVWSGTSTYENVLYGDILSDFLYFVHGTLRERLSERRQQLVTHFSNDIYIDGVHFRCRFLLDVFVTMRTKVKVTTYVLFSLL